jgi:hypothetical protein
MATNLDISQLNYKSAHDDLYIVGDSDGSSAVDFKFVVDVFANNKQLIRAKIFPDPTNSKCYFNISNIVSNEMKFDWFEPNGQVFIKQLDNSGQIYLPVQVRLGTDVSGITTLNLASGSVTVANTIPNLFKRQRTIFDNSVKQFYTNRDKLNLQSNYDEDLYVGCAITNGSEILRVQQYNSAGTFLASGNIAVPTPTTTNIFQLNISPDALVDAGITFNANCEYYEVQIRNLGLTIIDKVRVYFKCKTKYTPINLHFMNVYGLFDTGRFDCVSKLSMNKQTKSFEKLDVKYFNTVQHYDDLATTKYTNYQYYESNVNFGSQYDWSYKLTMDFPNDQDYQWLSELIMSPQVWAEIIVSPGQKEYYPISIKANNYEYSKHINNGLRAFEVEIEMNQKRNGFRR